MVVRSAADKSVENHGMSDRDNRWNDQIYVFADDFTFVEPKHFLKGIRNPFDLTDISDESYVHDRVAIRRIDALIV